MNKREFYLLADSTDSDYIMLSETENYGDYEMTISYSATKKIIEEYGLKKQPEKIEWELKPKIKEEIK